MHTMQHEPYLTACGNDRLTPWYDVLVRVMMREGAIRRTIVELARLAPGQRLLDIGCGTGTLAMIAKRDVPGAEIVGVDGDPKILAIARRKAARARLDVAFDEAMAYALPYPDGSFDAVVSSLVFHHLTPDQQTATLTETLRVLRPGGTFVVADLAPPHNRLMRATPLVRRLLGFSTRVHVLRHMHDAGRVHDSHRLVGRYASLPERVRAAGFDGVSRQDRFMTLLGTLAIYTARSPAGSAAPARMAVHGVAMTGH
jgi:ubiquinone/menaquinone biosynthesis C-methylase UbiE